MRQTNVDHKQIKATIPEQRIEIEKTNSFEHNIFNQNNENLSSKTLLS